MTVWISRSCCGCTLKKGAIITGFVNAFVGGCLLLFYVEEQIGVTYENSRIHDFDSQELIMISMIAGAVSLLTGIFLVVGARKEHSVMLLCWLIVYAVYVVLLAAGLMYGVFLLFNSPQHSDTTAPVFLLMGLAVIGKLCAKKWQILRAGYRTRRGNVLPSGSAVQKTKKWVYLDALNFLDPFIAGRSSITNTPVEVASGVGEPFHKAQMEEEVAEVEFVLEGSDSCNSGTIEDISASSPVTPTSTRSSTSNLRKSKGESERDSDMLNKYLEKKLKTEKKTSSMLFLESLHDDMESLSVEGRRAFRVKVQELLYAMLEQEKIQ